jgi:hypothetical protein
VRDGTGPGSTTGIKAKTLYPGRPASWPAEQPWLPDQVFALVQARLLPGKSIGFLPLAVHAPDEEERQRRGWPEEVRLVIERWLLLEYACVSLPANQDALVDAVSKGALDLSADLLGVLGVQRRAIPFTPLEEVQRAVARRLASADLEAVAARAVEVALSRFLGRV